MIIYAGSGSGGIYGYRVLFRLHGSAVFKSCTPALLSSIIFVILFQFTDISQLSEDPILFHPYPMGALIAAFSFLLVFRANFSYNRYWQAHTAIHQMHSKWLDCATELTAFHLQSTCFDSVRPPTFGEHAQNTTAAAVAARKNKQVSPKKRKQQQSQPQQVEGVHHHQLTPIPLPDRMGTMDNSTYPPSALSTTATQVQPLVQDSQDIPIAGNTTTASHPDSSTSNPSTPAPNTTTTSTATVHMEVNVDYQHHPRRQQQPVPTQEELEQRIDAKILQNRNHDDAAGRPMLQRWNATSNLRRRNQPPPSQKPIQMMTTTDTTTTSATNITNDKNDGNGHGRGKKKPTFKAVGLGVLHTIRTKKNPGTSSLGTSNKMANTNTAATTAFRTPTKVDSIASNEMTMESPNTINTTAVQSKSKTRERPASTTDADDVQIELNMSRHNDTFHLENNSNNKDEITPLPTTTSTTSFNLLQQASPHLDLWASQQQLQQTSAPPPQQQLTHRKRNDKSRTTAPSATTVHFASRRKGNETKSIHNRVLFRTDSKDHSPHRDSTALLSNITRKSHSERPSDSHNNNNNNSKNKKKDYSASISASVRATTTWRGKKKKKRHASDFFDQNGQPYSSFWRQARLRLQEGHIDPNVVPLPVFLEEAAHLLSLMSAVALSTLRNDLEEAESPLAEFRPNAPWPLVDPDAYHSDIRKEWERSEHHSYTVLRYLCGLSRTDHSRELYNVGRPFRVIGNVSDKEIQALQAARGPQAKVMLVNFWLQEFMSREYMAGSAGTIHAALMSRLFQFCSDGMAGYNDARKVAYIPFPFPHAQITTLFVLVIIGFIPVLMLTFVSNMTFGFVLNLITVMCFTGLHEVAREVENPFQNVPNDVPLNNFQAQFNEALMVMFFGFHPDAYWMNVDPLKQANAEAAAAIHDDKEELQNSNDGAQPSDNVVVLPRLEKSHSEPDLVARGDDMETTMANESFEDVREFGDASTIPNVSVPERLRNSPAASKINSKRVSRMMERNEVPLSLEESPPADAVRQTTTGDSDSTGSEIFPSGNIHSR